MSRSLAVVRALRRALSAACPALFLGAFAAVPAPSPAQAPPELAHESYLFPGGELLLRDWDGDGVRDVVLFRPAVPPDDAGRASLLQVWRARPDARARFGLRPDLDLRPPDGVFAVLYHPSVAPPRAGGGDAAAPLVLGADADGLLALGEGGAWLRIAEARLFGPPASATRPDSVVALIDLTADAADFDQDGWPDFPLLDAAGGVRIVWGAARPQQVVLSDPIARVEVGRTDFWSSDVTPSFLVGAAYHRGVSDGFPVLESLRARRPLWNWSSIEAPARLATGGPSPGSLWIAGFERLRVIPAREGHAAGLRLGDALLGAAPGRRFERRDGTEPPTEPAPEGEHLLPPPGYADRLRSWLLELGDAHAAGDGRDLFSSGVEDIDGDGVADAWVAQGSSDPVRPRTVLRVYLGRADGALPDASLPASTLRAKAPFAYPVFADLDGDGDRDTWLFELDAEIASPADQLKMYLQVGVRGRLSIYLWEQPEGLSSRRSHALPMDVRYEVYENRLPTLREVAPRADLDGDGVRDVGLQLDRRTYAVWRLDPGHGFAATPMLRLATAHPIRSVRSEDVDGRPGDDLILATADAEDASSAAFIVVLPRP